MIKKILRQHGYIDVATLDIVIQDINNDMN